MNINAGREKGFTTRNTIAYPCVVSRSPKGHKNFINIDLTAFKNALTNEKQSIQCDECKKKTYPLQYV